MNAYLKSSRSCAIAALLLVGAYLATAQETDNTTQTNEMIQAAAAAVEAAAAASDQTSTGVEAADDSGEGTVSTNAEPSSSGGLAPTAPERRSGREARNQRLRRQRSGQSDAGGGSSGLAHSGATNNPNSLDYSAFSLVTTRNIFDPNRFGGRSRQVGRSPRVDSFALVGVMSYEKGTFAFFSGSSREYQKALKNADSIAGYKLTAITPNSVKLALATNEVELRVGMQMRREEDGPWQASAASASYTASSNGGSTSAPPSASVPSGPDSDIIKRMMERREKE